MHAVVRATTQRGEAIAGTSTLRVAWRPPPGAGVQVQVHPRDCDQLAAVPEGSQAQTVVSITLAY